MGEALLADWQLPPSLPPLPSRLACTLAPQFEADRRAFIITINSFDTELSKEDRAKLFPHCGRLYPEGLAQLARADDYEQVKSVADYYPVSALATADGQVCMPNPRLTARSHSRCPSLPWARSTSCSSRAQAATLETRPWRTDSLSMR